MIVRLRSNPPSSRAWDTGSVIWVCVVVGQLTPLNVVVCSLARVQLHATGAYTLAGCPQSLMPPIRARTHSPPATRTLYTSSRGTSRRPIGGLRSPSSMQASQTGSPQPPSDLTPRSMDQPVRYDIQQNHPSITLLSGDNLQQPQRQPQRARRYHRKQQQRDAGLLERRG